jgi:hypothetical protein
MSDVLDLEASRLKPGDTFTSTKENTPWASNLAPGQQVPITVLRAREDGATGSSQAVKYNWRHKYFCRREDTSKEGYLFFAKGQMVTVTRGRDREE